MISRFSFKSGTTFLIRTLTSFRSFSKNFIFFKIVIVSSISIKRNFILLIIIVFLIYRLLDMLFFEIISISSSGIKFISSLLKMILVGTIFNWNFMRRITLIVLCLTIKFVLIWLVCIFCLIFCRLYLESFEIRCVCRLQKLRVVMTLIYTITTLFSSLRRNIIRFVKMLIRCFSLKLYMRGRTVMFA